MDKLCHVSRATTTHLEFAETLHVQLGKAKETHGHMDINVNNCQLIKKVCFQLEL